MVGLPDLARDAFTELDRSHRPGQRRAGSLAAAGTASPQQPPELLPLTTRQKLPTGPRRHDGPRNLLPAMTALWRYNPDHASATATAATANEPVHYPGRGHDHPLGHPELGRRPDHDGRASFDVKAYDNAFGGYADLGWGDDLRLYAPFSTYSNYAYSGNTPAVPACSSIAGTPSLTLWHSGGTDQFADRLHYGRHVITHAQSDIRP